jgi:hypothetical protein
VVDDTVEIIVEADQSGYTAGDDTRINDAGIDGFNLTFEDLGDGTYLFVYTVSDQDGSVSRGDLAINIVLVDSYGNDNSPGFTDLDPNNVTIHTFRPSAAISGTTGICYGDSTLITVNLGGMSPWNIVLSDGTNSELVGPIQESPYEFWVSPEVTTNYYIPRVDDSTGNTNNGIGRAEITVNPLPVVAILNLDAYYSIQSIPVVVEYLPVGTGGVFDGPGILPGEPVTFDPAVAGTENSPHNIIYTFTDQNTCTSADTALVNVVEASGSIEYESPVACFNDTSFIIVGSNTSGTTGVFRLDPPEYDTALTNLGDNLAKLDATILALEGDLNVTVIYTYLDVSGFSFEIDRPLLIEHLEDAVLSDPADGSEYCADLPAVPLSGSYGVQAVYGGTGVTGNDTSGYLFDPSLAIPGSNRITYYYTSANSCLVGDSIELVVYDAPVADFNIEDICIPETGGTVSFINLSRTQYGDEPVTEVHEASWNWNFGDIESGASNFSTQRDPEHFYEDQGTWNVTLRVSIAQGCDDTISKDIVLHANPAADFTWNSNCITPDPITLEGNETLFNDDFVTDRKWHYIIGIDTTPAPDTAKVQEYDFGIHGLHKVYYRVESNYGCVNSIEKEILFSPTIKLIVDEEAISYYQDFEGNIDGWSKDAGDPGQNSWSFEPVSGAVFPYIAASGQRAWYTDLPRPEVLENSWVLSPCFNFQEYYRPMVALDIKGSLDRDLDGAVLQYTADNGKTWTNVGMPDDGGQNWYNSNRIIDGPGGQGIGWTGYIEFETDETWRHSAHALDMLTGAREIRFRIAYGSAGEDTPGISDYGFAFDNFSITRRKRLTLLEHFSNANSSLSPDADLLVRELCNSLPADVIDVQYHSDYPSADMMYTDNPTVSSTRGIFYGNSVVPYAILDGGLDDMHIGAERRYDFDERSPSVADIHSRSLTPPDFEIEISNYEVGQFDLKYRIGITALKGLPARERTLYTLVVEDSITGTDYEGTNGQTLFRYVARKLLPDAGGTPLTKSWTEGESLPVNVEWNPIASWIDKGKMVIIAFIQDDNTRDILQAATTNEYDPSTGTGKSSARAERKVLLYPNPAGDNINVFFEPRPVNALKLMIYNTSGRLVLSERVAEDQMIQTLELDRLSDGVYIMELRNERNGTLYHRTRFFHY